MPYWWFILVVTRWARLVHWWVTACGRVNYPGMQSSTQIPPWVGEMSTSLSWEVTVSLASHWPVPRVCVTDNSGLYTYRLCGLHLPIPYMCYSTVALCVILGNINFNTNSVQAIGAEILPKTSTLWVWRDNITDDRQATGGRLMAGA